ncbi:MAG: GGDEF domain-containing protein [Atopobiaceae bacterium]|jgi:diguanylate cyclase (GGDEF)-like protein|nr:diguanylate cyclase [Atopobiaceae bacterium]MCH4180623.1 diguanylate cyclase [Atopobiaceae bacterium]MCH4214239.1 diguanylate cyclase [Atopobiaceae bacterium]MCH4277196.1 diguanylate cyclase [Atopobiaceae bacterium]MCI1227129.1 diguanylate cyclase [Atopobiaceae bacterium]
MDEKTESLLMEYLRNVIYDPQKAELDLAELPPSHRRLGEALVFLGQCAKEDRSFAKEIMAGNIDVRPPSIENGLAAPMKEMQGMLRHLRWQTREIAKGDYDQKIDYMGDIGEAFNLMSVQLKERQDRLVHERQVLEEQNRELDNMQLMITNLALDEARFIVITDESMTKVIFRTNTARQFRDKNLDLSAMLDGHLADCPSSVHDHMVTWDIEEHTGSDEDARHFHYSIRSYRLHWEDGHAIAHMIVNDTDEFERQAEMEHLAFSDALTNLHNRRYAMQLAASLREKGQAFALAFIDIDYLKYCNDEFGHEEGDRYLVALALLLKTLPGKCSVCRIGGDEFMVLMEDWTASELTHQLEKLRLSFMQQPVPTGYLFKRSFSYGVVGILPDDGTPLSDSLEEADQLMYAYKTSHKKFLIRRQ